MNKKTPTVAIIGGNLQNKGAQAMTFSVISQLKDLINNVKIILLSEVDYRSRMSSIFTYDFEILPWSFKLRLKLLLPFIRSNMLERLKDIDLMIDVSGYALSSSFFPSQFSSFVHSLRYLVSIKIAQKFNIPYFVFPQSIGPLNYGIPYKLVMDTLLKKHLKYPSKIYVRENLGLLELGRFRKHGVLLTTDLVLNNKGYDLNNIFRTPPKLKDHKIVKDSVGIIPNQKVYTRMGHNEFLDLYRTIFKRILDNGQTIYILRHSIEDLPMCNLIKQMFSNNSKVIPIVEDLLCMELENIISKFKFVIASRYHSVVHAFKNGIPVVCIGWADKYRELMEHFSQEGYFTDVSNLRTSKLKSQIDKMLKLYETEKVVINNKLKEFKWPDLYKEINLILKNV